MSKAEEKVQSYFNAKKAGEVVKLMQATIDPDAFSLFGKFMGVRQFGDSPHIELSSDAPGNSGQEKIVIYEEDIPAVCEIFKSLEKRRLQRLAALEAAVPEPEALETKSTGGKSNDNVGAKKSA